MSRHGHVLVQVFRASQASGINSVPLLIIGFHIVHFFEHSLIRTMIAHSCSTFVRNLQWVLHLRHCVPSWICGLSSCRHLLGLVQLLPVSFHSVLRTLVYLSRLLIVTVANELVHSDVCIPVSLRLTRKKATWDGSRSRYCQSSFAPCWCNNWLCFAGSCLRPHSRTAVVCVRTSFFVSAPRHASGSS